MEVIPIPAPIPIPSAFSIPDAVLIQPTIKPFEWEPIPLYVETTPQIPDSPGDNSSNNTEEEEEPTPKSSVNPVEAIPPQNLVPELAEVQTWDVPLIGVEIPVPRAEILVTATTTAGVSSVVAVGGTLFATTMFRQLQPILKPIFKIVFKKLAALRKKPPPLSWARERRLKKQRKESL